MAYFALLDVFLDGAWCPAARVTARDDGAAGRKGPAYLEYDEDHVLAHLDAAHAAVSCRYPVNFELVTLGRWPAFLMDLLPGGAPRRFWLGRLGTDDAPAADWPLLLAGAGNPPGNVRVRQAAPPDAPAHPGFAREEVLRHPPEFLDYAALHGAPLGGSSAVQGDAPKLLLVEDSNGRWHADGALPDAKAARHWVVKGARGREPVDQQILRHEAIYSQVAADLGLRVTPSSYEAPLLFVPRFDRVTTGSGVLRLGLESLASLAGEHGSQLPMERLCEAVRRFCSDPDTELIELVRRDVLNVALGNTDNHARNTSVLRQADGTVALSPLYDVAPMYLDPQLIPRVCRWTDAADHGRPDWQRVIDQLARPGLTEALRAWAPQLRRLPEHLEHRGADEPIVEQLRPRIALVASQLDGLR